MNRRLYRSVSDRKIGGVAAGTATYFDIDPSIARVLWLLLPTPRDGFARRSFPAVNAALRAAASTNRRDVRILDLGKVFSPDGHYRKWIRVGDREVGVRQADGIHLSDEGAAIAAKIVVRTLREERILG